ncbi:MAG TPA: TetR family transcriptional regulator [Pseudonocardiaceae bacterium]|nr:TetR family transcriptional regulator [Pseudonocardiaceae bacterium]
MSESSSRAQRRRDTEARILGAARSLFAAQGFQRTTIRAVAAAAAVDPALVMQYFGSKQDLFTAASRVEVDDPELDDPAALVELVLTRIGMKIGALPETSLAMIRSMLTHPEATEHARTALGGQIDQLRAAIPGPDAELRAGLVIAAMLGVIVSHQLLDLDALHGATGENIAELLRPAFRVLTGLPESTSENG